MKQKLTLCGSPVAPMSRKKRQNVKKSGSKVDRKLTRKSTNFHRQKNLHKNWTDFTLVVIIVKN